MRTHVSKVFAGAGIAWKDIFTLAEGEIVVFDWDTKQAISEKTTQFGAARGMANPDTPLIDGPVDVKGVKIVEEPYRALVKETQFLTVVTPPEAGIAPVIKVQYEATLGVAPNRLAQVVVSVPAVDGETADSYAQKLYDEFEKNTAPNGAKYFDMTLSGAQIEFIPYTLRTSEEPYDGVSKPEVTYLEVGAPDGQYVEEGEYKVEVGSEGSVGGTPVYPSGTPIQVRWLEDQHMGRLGFSDRVSWNDSRKYKYQAEYGKTYDMVCAVGNSYREGDMQNGRFNPVGAILALEVDTSEEITRSLGQVVPVSSPSPLDMDHDLNPDTVIFSNGTVTVTSDSDSINIDLDGDDDADIVIPKP